MKHKPSILITGCSKGIGLCAAQILHQRGYQVFAGARHKEDIAKLKEIGLEAITLDLNNSASIEKAVNQVLEKTGGNLDALFNNAGYGQPGAVEDLSRDVLRAQFETNVFGLIELTNLIIPVMRQQGRGRIINNSSVLGLIAMPYRGAYNASKYAVEGITDTLRMELHDSPIKVCLIEPGPIASQFRANAIKAYQANIRTDNSPHQPKYENMLRHFIDNPAGISFLQSPEAVVKKLIHALESKRPKAHYYVGFPTYLFGALKRLLPTQSLDWLIRKICEHEIKPT